jgi:hypothetical protein
MGDYPETGIGVVIRNKIAERHGRRILVESEIGKGSIFYFTLKINLTEFHKLNFNTSDKQPKCRFSVKFALATLIFFLITLPLFILVFCAPDGALIQIHI